MCTGHVSFIQQYKVDRSLESDVGMVMVTLMKQEGIMPCLFSILVATGLPFDSKITLGTNCMQDLEPF